MPPEGGKEAAERLREHIAQLRTEDAIFERLMYKNTSQHRGCLHFRRLQQVRRSLRWLRSAASDELVAAIARYFHGPNTVAKAFLRKNENATAKFESREALLSRLLGIARILQEMSLPILNASKQIAGLLEQCFFMSFALTIMAVLARFRVLTLQILLDAVAIYNLISVDLYNKAALTLQPFSKLQKELPSTLECKWDGLHCHLKELKASAETWFVDDRASTQAPGNMPNIIYKSAGTPLLNKEPKVGQKRDQFFNNEPEVTLKQDVTTPTIKKFQGKTEFLDFLEPPPSTATHSITNSRKVAYVSVIASSVSEDMPSSEPAKDSDATNGHRTDALFDLLLAGRTTESLF